MKHFEPIVLKTADEVAAAAAPWIVRRLEAATFEERRPSVVLAGGTTPKATYRLLEASALAWHRVDFFFGDERAVPPDHAESNFRMAKEAIADRLGGSESAGLRLVRMEADAPDMDAAARAYEALLPEVVDVLILGMGEDAHTASLFPGSPATSEHERRVVPVVGPKPPPKRLTITPRVIDAARNVLVLVTGAGKAEALARAAHGELDPTSLPIQLARRGTFYVDAAAASAL